MSKRFFRCNQKFTDELVKQFIQVSFEEYYEYMQHFNVNVTKEDWLRDNKCIQNNKQNLSK